MTSGIWKHGVKLLYQDDQGTKTLWLCRACHLNQRINDAYTVNGTRHVFTHLESFHRIHADGSPIPDSVDDKTGNPWQASIPGSASHTSHTPWQEAELQSAVVDWAVVRDLSFYTVTAPGTRGLLTWNRKELLRALPNSVTTLSAYVQTSLKERKIEIKALLAAAIGRINLSLDVWTSTNHLSFLGIVAHFVGKPRYLFQRRCTY